MPRATRAKVRLMTTRMKTTKPNPGFQVPKGAIAVIFAVVPSSSNKRTGKLALWDIMAGEPSTPKYLN